MNYSQEKTIQGAAKEKEPIRSFRISSKALDRVVYAADLAVIHVDELRMLYHEVYCDRQSMFKSVEDFREMIANADQEDEESLEYYDTKLRQLAKKLVVYNSFYKLIKREVSWRVSINKVARAQIAIQAKLAGISEAQINALLDPESCIHKLFTISEYSASPVKRKEITVADRIKSMRSEMFNAEFCQILSNEFEDDEVADMREEAMAKVDSAVDWKQIESILTEHMPDDNGVLGF